MRITTQILCLVAFLSCAASGRAANLTVTSTADSGPGSLRDAIASAAPGTTIDFAVSGAITLTSGELLVSKDLTISGPGAANLAVQRNASSSTFRVLHVHSGIVTVSGLTLSSGYDVSGGGVYNEATLTIRDCVVARNSASASGGGIFNSSTLTLSNCVILRNAALGAPATATGGGIFNDGTVTMLNCSVSANSASGGLTPGSATPDAGGGGIFNQGTLSMTNSVIEQNLAIAGPGGSGEGGGVYNEGTFALETSTADSNSAIGGTAVGGGFLNDLGTVTIVRCTMSSNQVSASALNASGGGAVILGQGAGIQNNFGTFVVESSTLSGNFATSTGTAPGGPAFLGGGIYNGFGSVSLNHCTITANILPPSSGGDGGGVFNSDGSVDIANTIVAADNSLFDFVSASSSGIHSAGFNLFGSTNGSFTLSANDSNNVSASVLRIGPLRDNGGPTLTHALLCGSAAIDQGNNAGAPPTDQRGFTRIVNGRIDIGAYEYSNSPPTIACSGAITNGVVNVSADVTDLDGDPLIVVWSMDGAFAQTNFVASGGAATSARVVFTALANAGAHSVVAVVSDPSGCTDLCSNYLTTSISSNRPPTISCSGPVNLTCVPPTGASATVTANVADVDGDALVVVWSVDGTPAQTNQVPAGGPPTTGQVMFTANFKAGAHSVLAAVSDPSNNSASCAASVNVSSNSPPTISCPAPVTLGCAPPAGETAIVTVTVADPNGDPLTVVWSVDGKLYQTNFVPTSAPPASAHVELTNHFSVGPHLVGVVVSDPSACQAACSTMVTVVALGDVYPIALHDTTLAGKQVGDLLPNIYNGSRSGNFGWLTWAGSPSEPTLVTSLTPPGNSSTYINPFNKSDHVLSVGDWAQGKPGVSNSKAVREALDALKKIDITVPVWDKATGRGNTSLYHIVGFAKVRLTDYQLPNQNRITAKFLGFTDCR